MLQVKQNIEKTKNLYKKAQKNPGRFSKTSLLAMAFFALATLVNADNVKPVTPEPQSMTTDGATATISTDQRHRTDPHELVLYYHGKNGGNITPEDNFQLCTISDRGGTPHKFTRMSYGKDSRIGLLNQEKNPRFPLYWFSMKKWHQLCRASPAIKDDVALSVSNQGKRPLFVTLPEFIFMRLFVFGNVVIENNARIENGSIIIGVDPRKLAILSSGCPFYADHAVPSTVRIKGRLRSGVLVVGSHVILETGLPKNWRLSNASVRVLDGQDAENDGPFGIMCYGRTKVVCAKTTRINGDVDLGSHDKPFRTDPSDLPNDAVAHFDNVIFAPKTLFIPVPFEKTGGYVVVKGQVDLTDTTIHIGDYNYAPVTKDTHIILSKAIIQSDRPIIGRPKIKCGPHWQIKCKIDGNNLSIIGHKQLSAQAQFPKGYS